MSSASSATGLLNNISIAEKELAMYAAIIGCKPTLEPAPAAQEEPPIQEDASEPDAHEPKRLTLWMRHMSHEARKRIHEAKMRLAS